MFPLSFLRRLHHSVFTSLAGEGGGEKIASSIETERQGPKWNWQWEENHFAFPECVFPFIVGKLCVPPSIPLSFKFVVAVWLQLSLLFLSFFWVGKLLPEETKREERVLSKKTGPLNFKIRKGWQGERREIRGLGGLLSKLKSPLLSSRLMPPFLVEKEINKRKKGST